jgi:transcription elongation factor/antiterminator RfaH
MSWYVVHTKPRMELLAATLLQEQLNLHTYYPEVTLRRRGRLQRGAFFPGYLFIACDLQTTALSAIDSTPGVVRVVRFQAEPRAVPDEVLEELRLRIDTLNAAGGLPAHQLRPGDPVRITAGPLQGLEGVFAGPLTAAERVMVLLRFLGSERRVTVDVDTVEPNGNPLRGSSEKRPRRSRGAGRPISYRGRGSTERPAPA